MAKSILSDCLKVIDQSKPHRLTKSILVKKWLADFAKQEHRPHYSNRFAFNVPLTAVEGDC